MLSDAKAFPGQKKSTASSSWACQSLARGIGVASRETLSSHVLPLRQVASWSSLKQCVLSVVLAASHQIVLCTASTVDCAGAVDRARAWQNLLCCLHLRHTSRCSMQQLTAFREVSVAWALSWKRSAALTMLQSLNNPICNPIVTCTSWLTYTLQTHLPLLIWQLVTCIVLSTRTVCRLPAMPRSISSG